DQSLLDVPRGGKGNPAVAPGASQIGTAANRLVEVGEGRRVGASGEMNRPALVAGFAPFLAIGQPDHLAPVGQGAAKVAEVPIAAGPVAVRVEVVGAQPDGSAALVDGVADVLFLRLVGLANDRLVHLPRGRVLAIPRCKELIELGMAL